jgi:hypothetical protein
VQGRTVHRPFIHSWLLLDLATAREREREREAVLSFPSPLTATSTVFFFRRVFICFSPLVHSRFTLHSSTITGDPLLHPPTPLPPSPSPSRPLPVLINSDLFPRQCHSTLSSPPLHSRRRRSEGRAGSRTVEERSGRGGRCGSFFSSFLRNAGGSLERNAPSLTATAQCSTLLSSTFLALPSQRLRYLFSYTSSSFSSLPAVFLPLLQAPLSRWRLRRGRWRWRWRWSCWCCCCCRRGVGEERDQ